MAAFTEGANFSTSANGKTLDPRLLDILKTAAAQYGMDVQATSGVAGRSTGTKNHPGGYAVDIKLIGPDGKALPNYQNAKSFPAYEKFAQTARVVQQQKYPELNNAFRWGGYFAGGPNPMDLMHFDINPKMNGAMAGGSWDNGVSSGYAKARGITTYNPGLSTVEGQRQVASIKQGLAGGPLPPMNIPQVGTALDTIDRVVPRAMPSQIASAYASTQTPPRMPANSAVPRLQADNTLSYGQKSGITPAAKLAAAQSSHNDFGLGALTDPRTAALLAPTRMPPSMAAAGQATAMPQSVGIHGAASLTAPAIDGVGAGPQWGDLAGMLNSGAPKPMPGRPAALSASAAPVPMPGRPASLIGAPPAPVQAQPPQLPTQRPSAPVAPPQQQQLRLASGQMIAPGIYDQGDHSVMVSDAGDGTAKVERVRGPMSVPGVIDPLREANANTIAGGMIRKMLPGQLAGNASNFVPAVTDNVKSAAVGAAQNLGNSIGGMFGGLGSMFAPKPPSLPTFAQLQAIRSVPANSYYRPAPMPMSRPLSFFAQPAPQAPTAVPVVARSAAPSQSNGGGYANGRQNAINDTLRTLGFNV